MNLGARLQQARLARELSLEDAAHATRVPAARLAALERDDLASFGSMSYARAFLKLYAVYLGVDAKEVLNALPGGVLGGSSDYRYLVENHGPWIDPKRPLNLSVAPRAAASRAPAARGWAIFVGLLLLTVTGIFARLMDNAKAQVTASALPPPSVESDSVAEPVPLVSSVRVAAESEIPQVPLSPPEDAAPPSPQEVIPLEPKIAPPRPVATEGLDPASAKTEEKNEPEPVIQRAILPTDGEKRQDP
ncbi:MAG: helix-turn-helix domain-containing protein [Verrucomicrobiales bacterium]|nr:helix-turn-helix domain-containing protein [Verrucomicrobiales bacterium]